MEMAQAMRNPPHPAAGSQGASSSCGGRAADMEGLVVHTGGSLASGASPVLATGGAAAQGGLGLPLALALVGS
jgi:hypothetical protein